MKTLVFCQLAALVLLGEAASRPFSPYPPTRKPEAFLPRNKFDKEHDPKRKVARSSSHSNPNSIRGGDLGPITSLGLSKIFSGIVSLDGVWGTLAPSAICERFSISVPEGSFVRFCTEAIGGTALNLAVTSFLATTKQTSVEKAVGYGLLAQLFFALRAVVTNPEHTTKTLVMPFKCFYYAAVPYTFLSSSKLDPWVALKIGSSLSLVTALYNYLNPSGGASLLYGGGLDQEGDTTKEMYRLAAGYDVVGNTYMLLLAQGMDPIEAVGYASLLVTLWMMDLAYLRKDLYDLFSGIRFFNMQTMTLIVLFFSAVSGGILLDVPSGEDASSA